MELTNIKFNKYISKDDRVLLALSGGIDSMSLFYLLLEYRKLVPFHLEIAHINHKRRKESDEEYIFIQNLSSKNNTVFNGKELKNCEDGINFQAWAHKERYNFFYQIMNEHNLNKLFVAHNEDDLIETILMRITRGTTYSAYQGFNEISKFYDKTLIRPLIYSSRKEIVDYQQNLQFEYREDNSNYHNDYTRNRFRHNIIPLLKEENPALGKAIHNLSEYIYDSYSKIEEEANSFLKDKDYINISEFHNLKNIIQEDVIKKMVNNFSLNSIELSYEKTKDIIKFTYSNQPNGYIEVKKDVVFIKNYDTLKISNKPLNSDFYYEINDYGNYEFNNFKVIISKNELNIKDYIYYKLCYNNLAFPIIIRNRCDGDKICNNGITKKVKDLFIDKKVPLDKRNQIPMFIYDKQIVFIPNIIRVSPKEGSNTLHIYFKEL